ncbi:katanin p60 ATPase-containing subunit A-like 2 isoform X2 [Diprion similis]|uniref:katanin p60 ATPase-containing subunit A-like 2 isoform X2 n=1 Tax=Diprion similis TaxID=362088 RepID=UPI001EF79DA3|nr:katanin p60 ATPase-containing subunit A-like 2 isoform X2 [Diprion similis]
MADYLSSYSSSKIAHVAREKEEKRSQERRRSLMYLIAEFLREQGCIDTVESLVKEAQLSGDYQVCDNIDLDTVLVEFSDYHYAKYNKYPKICKKVEGIACNNAVNINPIKKEKINKNFRKPSDVQPTELSKSKPLPKVNNLQAAAEPNFGITVTPVFQCPENAEHVNVSVVNEDAAHFTKERILKPIGNLYQLGTEWRDMADTISRDIVMTDLNVHWDDIEGLKECKSLLKEATVYPMKYPELFGGKLAPWQGILLYGPPGTGKTMLAKAVATECKTTFFNISSTSIISKWRGDSEKLVRILFDLAEHHAPAVIFIDEADWVAGSHADVTSLKCSDPARRFRAELLARMDGLVSSKSQILLLAATNSPWELDAALLRRLEKRILVDLPDVKSRFEFLRSYVHIDLLQDKDFFELVQKTEGYSCADLKLICKEAWMMQLRPIWQMLEENKIVRGEVGKIHHGAISKLNYLQIALDRIKPTAKHIANMYKQWKEKFGAS